jgi:hypothetical protein
MRRLTDHEVEAVAGGAPSSGSLNAGSLIGQEIEAHSNAMVIRRPNGTLMYPPTRGVPGSGGSYPSSGGSSGGSGGISGGPPTGPE